MPVLESENKDEEAKSDPGTDLSPSLQPCLAQTLSPPNTAPEDGSGENKKAVSSDQVNEKAATDFGESDSSVKTNDSDLCSQDQHPSTIPEHKASGSTVDKQDSKLSLGETHISEDNQQQTGLTDSADQYEADITSHRPQSPADTKPVNRHTHTYQRSVDSDGPNQEEETKPRKGYKCEDKAVD